MVHGKREWCVTNRGGDADEFAEYWRKVQIHNQRILCGSSFSSRCRLEMRLKLLLSEVCEASTGRSLM